MIVTSFELFLLGEPGAPVDAEKVLKALLASGRIQRSPPDPDRASYRNPDTGVFFDLILAHEIARSWRSRPADEDGDEEEAYAGDLADEQPETSEIEPADDDEEEDDEEDEVVEGEPEESDERARAAAASAEPTPVAFNVPLLVPSFFAGEALALAEAVARAAGLHLERAEPGESAAGCHQAPAHAPSSVAEVLSAWEEARREVVRSFLEQGASVELHLGGGVKTVVPITSWSREKVEAWWRYGRARAELADRLSEHHVRVPVLQAAFHGGTVKTLCDWEAGAPWALPATDLVLVRRRRPRKGLFRTKDVLEEGIAPGEKVRAILAPAAEAWTDPAELLVDRGSASLGPAAAEAVASLFLEPLESARRVPLVGVVDLVLEELRKES